MTTLRIIVNGVRLTPDVELPQELGDVEPCELLFVLMAQKGGKLASYSSRLEIVSETVPLLGKKTNGRK